MSDKDRQKKDGKDKNQKNQNMREDVARRKQNSSTRPAPPNEATDKSLKRK